MNKFNWYQAPTNNYGSAAQTVRKNSAIILVTLTVAVCVIAAFAAAIR